MGPRCRSLDRVLHPALGRHGLLWRSRHCRLCRRNPALLYHRARSLARRALQARQPPSLRLALSALPPTVLLLRGRAACAQARDRRRVVVLLAVDRVPRRAALLHLCRVRAHHHDRSAVLPLHLQQARAKARALALRRPRPRLCVLRKQILVVRGAPSLYRCRHGPHRRHPAHDGDLNRRRVQVHSRAPGQSGLASPPGPRPLHRPRGSRLARPEPSEQTPHGRLWRAPQVRLEPEP
eukprot:Amastigsp_a1333_33.p2 type:complete len:237 gc:universal Amastigsp_a1333_33:969-1679(+)